MAFHTKKDEERFNNAAETRRNRPQWKVKLANELLTQKKKIFPRRRVYAGKVDQIWALDLADVAKYKKQNRVKYYVHFFLLAGKQVEYSCYVDLKSFTVASKVQQKIG